MPVGTLKMDGEIERPVMLTFADLAAMDHSAQIIDVSRIDASRRGDAVSLAGLLQWVGVKASAQFLGLHSSRDNFHASIPLTDVIDRAFLIYRLDGEPLPVSLGGPTRFFIPDHASCKASEIDECANVKFVDHMELTTHRGFDNRPLDEAEHARLHRSTDHK